MRRNNQVADCHQLMHVAGITKYMGGMFAVSAGQVPAQFLISSGDHDGLEGLLDFVELDQDIGEFRGSCGDVEHAAAAQDRKGHGIVSQKVPRMIDRSAEGAERCLMLSCSGARPFWRSS